MNGNTAVEWTIIIRGRVNKLKCQDFTPTITLYSKKYFCIGNLPWPVCRYLHLKHQVKPNLVPGRTERNLGQRVEACGRVVHGSSPCEKKYFSSKMLVGIWVVSIVMVDIMIDRFCPTDWLLMSYFSLCRTQNLIYTKMDFNHLVTLCRFIFLF